MKIVKIAVFSTQGFERYTLDDANKKFGEQLDRSLDAILVKGGRTFKQTSSFVITSVAALPSALAWIYTEPESANAVPR